MFIILDPCSIGLGAAPDGGITLRISELGGFLQGVDLAIPIGEEAAKSMIEEANKIMGHGAPKIYGMDDLRRETGDGEAS